MPTRTNAPIKEDPGDVLRIEKRLAVAVDGEQHLACTGRALENAMDHRGGEQVIGHR